MTKQISLKITILLYYFGNILFNCYFYCFCLDGIFFSLHYMLLLLGPVSCFFQVKCQERKYFMKIALYGLTWLNSFQIHWMYTITRSNFCYLFLKSFHFKNNCFMHFYALWNLVVSFFCKTLCCIFITHFLDSLISCSFINYLTFETHGNKLFLSSMVSLLWIKKRVRNYEGAP